MIADVEAIEAAVFALLAGMVTTPTVQKFTRKYISTTDFSNLSLPVVEFFITRESQDGAKPGSPTKLTLHGKIFVFVSTIDTAVEPTTALNNIVKGVRTVLAPAAGANNYQTLGGLVVDCRINGDVERDPGFISGVGAAAIPLEITTTT